MITFFGKSIRFLNYRTSLVLCGLWFAGTLTSVALLFLGVNAYQEAEARLHDQARTYAHLIAAHDRYGFTLADALLLGVMDQLQWSDFNEPMTPQRHAQVVRILKRHQDRLPGIASFSIVGVDGIRRAGVINKDGTDLSARGYFRFLAAGNDFFISNAEEGLASGKTGIHVAHRFAGKDNAFGGVLVLNLAVQDVFFAFYRSLNLGANSRTTIQDPQKALLVFPGNSKSASATDIAAIASKMLTAGLNAESAKTTDPADRVERFTAFERLEGSNLVATVSLPSTEALASARFALWTAIFGSLASLLTTIGATVVIARIKLVADARDEALRADGEKRKFIQAVHAAIEEERRSIAVEIHDELNATLVCARLESQSILALANRIPLSDDVARIKDRANSIVALTLNLYKCGRAIVTRLRPEVLDTLGLQGAIEEMARHYDTIHAGCRYTFQCHGDLSTVSGALSIAVYRIAQEALSNIVKHSRATQATIIASVSRSDGRLRLSISDNGQGFEPSTAARGTGCIGMAERVFAFRGSIEFRTAPEKGTEVEVELPLKHAATA